MNDAVSRVIENLGIDFSELSISKFNTQNNIMANHLGVEHVGCARFQEYNKNNQFVFYLPLKDTPQSNLNCFFGKGRKCLNGFILPRPWYEVEIIVPREVTSQNGYPKERPFKVITADGWMFCCETNGDYSKNFRSSNDLKILGKWIKGAMESDEVLLPGQPVTSEVLDNFGKRNLCLASTTEPNTWLLSME